MLERSVMCKKYLSLTRFDISNRCSLKSLIQSAKELSIENSLLFEKLIDLVSKCLVYDPEARISVHEALNHPFFTSCTKYTERTTDVPWPSLPYNQSFLPYKNYIKPKTYKKSIKADTYSQNASHNSKHSTAVSRNSLRVTSSDEDTLNSENPASNPQCKDIM